MVVTDTLRAPALGLVEKVTVIEVAVAAVTVPTAPLLNTTVLFAAVVLKPKPLICRVVVAAVIAVVADVTIGVTTLT